MSYTLFNIPAAINAILSLLTNQVLPQLAAIQSTQRQGIIQMSEDFTKLNQGITDLQDVVKQVVTQLDADFQALKNAQGSGNQAAIDAATANVEGTINTLKDALARDTTTQPSAPTSAVGSPGQPGAAPSGSVQPPQTGVPTGQPSNEPSTGNPPTSTQS